MKSFLKNSLAIASIALFGPACANAQYSSSTYSDSGAHTPAVTIDKEGKVTEVTTPTAQGAINEVEIDDAVPALEGEYRVSELTKDVMFRAEEWNTELYLEPAQGNQIGMVLHFTIPRTGAKASELKTAKKVTVAVGNAKNIARVYFQIGEFNIPFDLTLKGLRLQTQKPFTVGELPSERKFELVEQYQAKSAGYEVSDLTQNINDDSAENGHCFLVLKKDGAMTVLIVEKGPRAELFKKATLVKLLPTMDPERFKVTAEIEGSKVLETEASTLQVRRYRY